MKKRNYTPDGKNSNFVTGARIAVLLFTETTQKIHRGGAEVDIFSRSRYYNKNYGYLSTSDEGYFFSGKVYNFNFSLLKFSLPLISRYFFLSTCRCLCNSALSLPLIYPLIISDLIKASEKSRSIRFKDGDYGVLAVVLLHHPLGATNLDFRRELSEYLEEGMQVQFNPRVSGNYAMKSCRTLVTAEFLKIIKGRGLSGRLDTHYYVFTLCGLLLARELFERKFLPGKHSVFTYRHIICPSGDDFDCLIDKFLVQNINEDGIIDLTLSF